MWENIFQGAATKKIHAKQLFQFDSPVKQNVKHETLIKCLFINSTKKQNKKLNFYNPTSSLFCCNLGNLPIPWHDCWEYSRGVKPMSWPLLVKPWTRIEGTKKGSRNPFFHLMISYRLPFSDTAPFGKVGMCGKILLSVIICFLNHFTYHFLIDEAFIHFFFSFAFHIHMDLCFPYM